MRLNDLDNHTLRRLTATAKLYLAQLSDEDFITLRELVTDTLLSETLRRGGIVTLPDGTEIRNSSADDYTPADRLQRALDRGSN